MKKYTPEERREREKRHGPVARQHFEEVIRRLITMLRPKSRGS